MKLLQPARLCAQCRPVIAFKRRTLIAALLAALLLPGSHAVHAFQPLFNGRDLSGWDTWLGIETVPRLPLRLFGDWEGMLGLNTPNEVFSVVLEDGEPAIRVSGEIWGALISHASYSRYHLRLQFKWGAARHAPRRDKPPNTGLLYHSVGDYGAFWSYWMRSAEFEIMQGSTGNLTSVDGVTATVPGRWDFSVPIPWLRYAAQASGRSIGGLLFRVQALDDFEKPVGQWNDLELMVDGTRATHLVNGRVVMTLSDLRTPDGAQLAAGRLQLQSEGAEVFFRRIALQEMP
ncbi:MAG: DUF1080 domain-containing protein [Halioglobus sp.]|nr:DUF1080 domain-containing protein [Halioglobus sp.]